MINFTRKLYCVCEYCTYQTSALLSDIFLFWFGAAYELRLGSYTATKLQVAVSKYAPRGWWSTSEASVQLFRAWHVKSVHTRTTERVEL